jgi:hypothetical protein
MASTISHQRSPFRKGSPYAASGERRDSSAHVRFQQEADAIALELQRSLNDMSTTKTIAPRDALLDYEEDEDMPLGLYNSLDSQQELEQPSRSSIFPDTQSDIGDTVKIDYIVEITRITSEDDLDNITANLDHAVTPEQRAQLAEQDTDLFTYFFRDRAD